MGQPHTVRKQSILAREIPEIFFLLWVLWCSGYYCYSFFDNYRDKILSVLKFLCNG